MGFTEDIVLPSHICRKQLSQRFNTHFTDKIGNIRTTLQAGLNDGYVPVMSFGDSTFEGIPLTIYTISPETFFPPYERNEL